jgi:hypothetical protein
VNTTRVGTMMHHSGANVGGERESKAKKRWENWVQINSGERSGWKTRENKKCPTDIL